jgi:hypothetical protein
MSFKHCYYVFVMKRADANRLQQHDPRLFSGRKSRPTHRKAAASAGS